MRGGRRWAAAMSGIYSSMCILACMIALWPLSACEFLSSLEECLRNFDFDVVGEDSSLMATMDSVDRTLEKHLCHSCIWSPR